MLKRLLRGIFSVIGLILGYFISEILLTIPQVDNLTYISTTITRVLFIIIISFIFGLIFYIISPIIYKGISNLIEYIEKSMQKMSITEIIYGTFGAVIALILMTFIAKPINDINIIGPILLILLNVLAAIIGAEIMIKKKEDITALLVNMKKPVIKEKKVKEVIKESIKGIPKVLDTSVIIDGRIFDICETGFVEGPLVYT